MLADHVTKKSTQRFIAIGLAVSLLLHAGLATIGLQFLAQQPLPKQEQLTEVSLAEPTEKPVIVTPAAQRQPRPIRRISQMWQPRRIQSSVPQRIRLDHSPIQPPSDSVPEQIEARERFIASKRNDTEAISAQEHPLLNQQSHNNDMLLPLDEIEPASGTDSNPPAPSTPGGKITLPSRLTQNITTLDDFPTSRSNGRTQPSSKEPPSQGNQTPRRQRQEAEVGLLNNDGSTITMQSRPPRASFRSSGDSNASSLTFDDLPANTADGTAGNPDGGPGSTRSNGTSGRRQQADSEETGDTTASSIISREDGFPDGRSSRKSSGANVEGTQRARSAEAQTGDEGTEGNTGSRPLSNGGNQRKSRAPLRVADNTLKNLAMPGDEEPKKEEPKREKPIKVTSPRLRYSPKPSYPSEAKRLNQTGEVVLRVAINTRGRVEDVEIKQSSGYSELDEAAAKSVRRWEYEPARKGEAPVPSHATARLSFNLEKD